MGSGEEHDLTLENKSKKNEKNKVNFYKKF